LRHLDPNNTPLPPSSKEWTPCIVDNYSLDILQLPLISKLNKCSKLIASIPYKLTLVGLDSSSIIVEPLSNPMLELKAFTPIHQPNTNSKWTPLQMDVNSIRGLVEYLGIVKKEDIRSYVNPLPYQLITSTPEGILKLNGCGHVILERPRNRQVDVNSLNDIVIKDTSDGLAILHNSVDEIITLHKLKPHSMVYEEFSNNEYRVLIRTEQGVDVIVHRNKIMLRNISETLKVSIEHNILNPRIMFLQPLAFVEEYARFSKITSPIVCLNKSSSITCITSVNPMEVLIMPGKVVVNTSTETMIAYGNSNKVVHYSFNMLSYMINKPFEIHGKLRLPYLKIVPDVVELLQIRYNISKENCGELFMYLLNISGKAVQAEIWLPARILQCEIKNLGTGITDTLEADYNTVVISMNKFSLYEVKLKVKRIPSLFLRELEKRPLISPYTLL